MCFALPVKVIAKKGGKIIVRENGRQKEASGSLIKAKKGDYVLLENNFIIKKVDKKSAEEIINLIK